ncbi:MAG: hypothetical protein WC095_02850 [Candidatus Paceibacterota bacterium]
MSHLVSSIYRTSTPERFEPFHVDKYIFSESTSPIRFGKHGQNFCKWFEGAVIFPEPSHLIFSCECTKAFHEEDLISETGDLGPISLANIFYLLATRSSLIGVSNLFISTSPLTGENHLLVLVEKGGLWTVRGYDKSVRENREWFPNRRVLSANKPL